MNLNPIPYFEDEKSKPKEGLPVVEREAVNVVIYDPSVGKVLCLDWSNFNWKTFIIGGVEGEEDVVDAALREITEETGYKNVEFVSEICKTRSGYFAAHKNENRISNATCLLFKLLNDEKDEISAEENSIHTLVWIPIEEVGDFVNLSSQKYLWEKVKDNLK
jgi:8-oxo-dGTP pyrophosphatase MutT (NUDIX family)